MSEWTPCGLGICAAEDGHEGTCAAASGWGDESLHCNVGRHPLCRWDDECSCSCHPAMTSNETKENERVVAQDLSQRDVDPRDQHPSTPAVGVRVRQDMATDVVVAPETKENETA